MNVSLRNPASGPRDKCDGNLIWSGLSHGELDPASITVSGVGNIADAVDFRIFQVAAPQAVPAIAASFGCMPKAGFPAGITEGCRMGFLPGSYITVSHSSTLPALNMVSR